MGIPKIREFSIRDITRSIAVFLERFLYKQRFRIAFDDGSLFTLCAAYLFLGQQTAFDIFCLNESQLL